MTVDLTKLELEEATFWKISQIVYRIAGITLPVTKIGLVKSRLMKRLRYLDIANFERYVEYIDNDKSGKELALMIDIITTNKTNFFRENQHFEFIKNNLLPNLSSNGQPYRIWSAGCSSGAEPYTLAMILLEDLPHINSMDIKILATDLSDEMLETARKGEYDINMIKDIPNVLVKKYFNKVKSGNNEMYRAKDNIRSLIKFAHHNLMGNWPMKGPFDLIFCRNVMIYFDRETRQSLIERFYSKLKGGGFFFVGHSESLTTTDHNFRYIQPAVYQK